MAGMSSPWKLRKMSTACERFHDCIYDLSDDEEPPVCPAAYSSTASTAALESRSIVARQPMVCSSTPVAPPAVRSPAIVARPPTLAMAPQPAAVVAIPPALVAQQRILPPTDGARPPACGSQQPGDEARSPACVAQQQILPMARQPPTDVARPPACVAQQPGDEARSWYHDAQFQFFHNHFTALPRGSPATDAEDEAPAVDPGAPADDDWKMYEIRFYRDGNWWNGEEGILDARIKFVDRKDNNANEGTTLEKAYRRCRWILARHACEFKVGMARQLGVRWRYYQDGMYKWKPTHLFIVMDVRGRAAVGMAEAALIRMLLDSGDYDDSDNINLRNNDKGGSGPRLPEHEFSAYYLYLATKAAVEPQA